MATSGVRYFMVVVQEASGPKRSLGRFATFSGGEASVTIGTAWNGGAKVPDRTQSRRVFGNITVSRPYSHIRDRGWLRSLNSHIGTEYTYVVSKVDLDANDVVQGDQAETWTGCLVVRVSEPAYSEDDSSPAFWEVEFAVQSRGVAAAKTVTG